MTLTLHGIEYQLVRSDSDGRHYRATLPKGEGAIVIELTEWTDDDEPCFFEITADNNDEYLARFKGEGPTLDDVAKSASECVGDIGTYIDSEIDAAMEIVRDHAKRIKLLKAFRKSL
jgi:hypothetical protein